MEKVKVNGLFFWIVPLFILCAGFILISGSAAQAVKKAGGTVETLKVCPTAKISTLEYFMKKSKFSGGPKLHVKVGITNISDKALRYRVSIFLPDGASSGGFFPRKGKPPVIRPGEEKIRTFPMYYDRIPDTITVKVDTL